MATNTIVFGQSMNNVATPHSFQGMSGWWQVPNAGLYCRPAAGGTNNWECSPNEDFSAPVYVASMDYDGTMCFQDILADKITGNE